jgi:hypothetical protein
MKGVENWFFVNGMVVFKHDGVRYTLDKNGSFTTDKGLQGRYYCDGAKLSLEQFEVQQEFDAVNEKINMYNTGQLEVFKGERSNIIDISLLEDVTDTLVTLINQNYRSQYFKDFKNLLSALDEYCTLSTRLIDNRNSASIKQLLKDIIEAKNNHSTNQLVDNSGLKWKVFSNPTENMDSWSSSDISKNISAKVPVMVYVFMGQRSRRIDVQNVDAKLKKVMSENDFDCRTDGVRWLEILALKYGVDDIRHFYTNDLRFLRQFAHD